MPQGSSAFNSPLWISIRIDDEAVEHYRTVGGFTPAEERAPLSVEVVQRDDLSPDGDPDRTHSNPAQVRMNGIRFTPDEAQDLARLLNSAATLINNSGRRERVFWSYNGGYGLAPASPAKQVLPQRRSA